MYKRQALKPQYTDNVTEFHHKLGELQAHAERIVARRETPPTPTASSPRATVLVRLKERVSALQQEAAARAQLAGSQPPAPNPFLADEELNAILDSVGVREKLTGGLFDTTATKNVPRRVTISVGETVVLATATPGVVWLADVVQLLTREVPPAEVADVRQLDSAHPDTTTDFARASHALLRWWQCRGRDKQWETYSFFRLSSAKAYSVQHLQSVIYVVELTKENKVRRADVRRIKAVLRDLPQGD